MERHVVVNADDFGLSESVNRGVARAFEQGIVTSASLMVDAPAGPRAAAYARRHPDLSVGLHLDLGEWQYESDEWRCVRQVLQDEGPESVAAQVHRQLEQFQKLMGQIPTHIDSHQHVHTGDPTRGIVLSAGQSLGVVVRHVEPKVQHIGGFYGQTGEGTPLPANITVSGLLQILGDLGPGVSEVACHPADAPVDSTYDGERAVELETLCHPRVHQAVADLDIRLCSFKTLPRPSL